MIALSHIAAFAQSVSVPPYQAERIGAKIFANECGSRESCLTWWNPGEQFASLGIGHFIWYPPDKDGPFQESFPEFLSFAVKNGVDLPAWLTPETDCPWRSRDDFNRARISDKMVSLQNFLTGTIPLQTQFMIHRLAAALPRIIAAADSGQQESIREKISLLLEHPAGLYALTDYVNFKGEGLLESERYKGQGWGLLQVLQEMNKPIADEDPLPRFADAAELVLRRRVQNSPPERNEARWLPGWRKRISTYFLPF